MSTVAHKSRLLLKSGSRRLLLPALVLTVLLPGFAAHRVHAQDATWGGTVEVKPSTFTIREGESASYELRLTEATTADDWWAMIHVRIDGEELTSEGYGDGKITWVPSVGWEFDQDNWDTWRRVTIRTEEGTAGKSLSITHEVWDHETNCPVHGVGLARLRLRPTRHVGLGAW